jgi:cytidylate kinase
MENLLYEYMSKRFNAELEYRQKPTDLGPVITISRQAGCGASKLAHDICQVMNTGNQQAGKPGLWRFINHEILEESASQLNLDPAKLNRVITDSERGMMDQIVEALSSHSHKSDKKIMKTLQDVIRQFAEQGYVVIVGRGGAVLGQDIAHSLHVRLEAPIEWRVDSVMKKLEYSRQYSMEYIKKMDEQRAMYVKKMAEGSKNHSLYDVILDPSRFNNSQMVDIICKMAMVRGIS